MDGGYPVDSDEETQLHEELDAIIEVQEKMDTLGIDLHKYIANVFQKYALRITELEQAYSMMCRVFTDVQRDRERMLENEGKEQQDEREEIISELSDVCQVLGSVPVQGHVIDAMFEDCIAAQAETVNADEGDTKVQHETVLDSCDPRTLLGGSPAYRHFILNVPTDDVFCQLAETSIAQHLKHSQLKLLAVNSLSLTAKENEIIIPPPAVPEKKKKSKKKDKMPSSPAFQGGHWFVLLSGKAMVTPHVKEDDPDNPNSNGFKNTTKGSMTVGPGDVFGAFTSLQDANFVIAVRAITSCSLIAIPLEGLGWLQQTDPVATAGLEDISADTYRGSGDPDLDISESARKRASMDVRTMTTGNVEEYVSANSGKVSIQTSLMKMQSIPGS